MPTLFCLSSVLPANVHLGSGQQIRKDKGLETEGLYAIQALVQPIALRFKYHFEGTRQTNRLDKVSYGLVRFRPHILTHPPSLSGISHTLPTRHMSTGRLWSPSYRVWLLPQNTAPSMRGYVGFLHIADSPDS